MLELTNQEISKLKHLVYSEEWKTAKNVANLFCAKIRESKINSQTEWGFTKNSLLKEGKVDGIQEFLTEINKIADNYD